MKDSSRIILNTLATYGRSVFALVVTLFSARWVLQALGETDFGLYGVVGSLILLITFVTGGMITGVARFYAFSIGRGHHLSMEEATDDLKRWFNTAFSIHLILPIVVIAAGYPIGMYAIENWLTIPPDRMESCLLVFRISLVTAFVSVFSIPFIAMYTAHQLITELAIFDIIRSSCTFLGAYYLLRIETDRLIFYALIMMAINVLIPVLQILRAIIKFKACRLHLSYMYCWKYLRELLGFVGWKVLGVGCVVSRNQGSPILINLFFGPQVNAAFNIANRVSIQATMLSTAMMNAFQPAITTMEGRGHREKMLETAIQVCKFGTLLVLLFVIPLLLEMDTVLTLWLEKPPEYTGPLCQWMLVMLVIDRMTAGQMLAVNAFGKIALYEIIQGSLLLLSLPMAWMLFKAGHGPVGIGYSLTVSMALYCIGRLLFCKKLLHLPIGRWFKQVAVPVAALIGCSAAIGVAIMNVMDDGFYRLCITTAGSVFCTLLLGWFWLLSNKERMFVRESFSKIAVRLR
jgi:O-antigen/teichoic acid export membrane protein